MQKEESTEQDATLVTDSAIRPPQLDRLEPCWSVIQLSVLTALLAFLIVSDLLHLFDSKSDHL